MRQRWFLLCYRYTYDTMLNVFCVRYKWDTKDVLFMAPRIKMIVILNLLYFRQTQDTRNFILRRFVRQSKFRITITLLQTERWGSVEWHHDIDVFQSRARLAAATLLVHTTSEDVRTVFNKEAITMPV